MRGYQYEIIHPPCHLDSPHPVLIVEQKKTIQETNHRFVSHQR